MGQAKEVRLANDVKEFRVYPKFKRKTMTSVKQRIHMLDSLLRNILATIW